MDQGWKTSGVILSPLWQQFWELWGECGQSSEWHVAFFFFFFLTYFILFAFDRDVGSPDSGWKGCS